MEYPMKAKRIFVLFILAMLIGSPAFCQARRGNGKGHQTTVARPSAKIVNGFNKIFEGSYFFNYEANNSECDVVFKQANTAGIGSGFIIVPESDQKQSFSYNITANGSIYIKIDGLKMKKEKITWHFNPDGFIIENLFFQWQADAQKYYELINYNSESDD